MVLGRVKKQKKRDVFGAFLRTHSRVSFQKELLSYLKKFDWEETVGEMGAAMHGRLVWVHTGEGRAAKVGRASEKIETLKETQKTQTCRSKQTQILM